ncbi:MAG TPA: ABC transporter permease subunit [Terriglobales bacterium]|jgi:ABC-type transport system involved in multi-copper enzyme maturation permease subunit
MIRKELNLRMRERRGWILPSLYLVVLGAVVTLAYYLSALENRRVQGAEVGVAIFITAAYTQMAILLLLAPIFSAGSLTIEKEQRTFASLLTSLLTPFQIWFGKFAASLLFVLLLIVIGIPVLSISFAFGGIGPWEVFIAIITTVIALGAFNAIGLYWSSVFRRSVHATAVTYATVIALTVVTFIIFIIEISVWREGRSWADFPWSMKLPLYLNPVFFLTMSFAPPRHLFPEWVRCLGVFVFLGLLATGLTLWNLRRSGEVA